MSGSLLNIEHLSVSYEVEGGVLPAVHDVTFGIRPGQMLGLVGESGCGKSTVASALLRILASNALVMGGSLIYKGTDLLSLSEDEMREIRGREIAMVFQDPLSSLNPTMTIGNQLLNVGASHADAAGTRKKAIKKRALELLNEMGIPDPVDRFDDYPHQFSGGMRQRIMIAMALMLEPALLIADEATSALDVTLQAQILETLRRLQSNHGTAVLLVSHDMGVIAETCDQVVVMYAGRVVELAETIPLFEDPLHPYTEALLASIPSFSRRGEGITGIPGVVPSLHNLPPGCKFADRCRHRQPTCEVAEPALLGEQSHLARCYLLDPTSGVTAVPSVPVTSAVHAGPSTDVIASEPLVLTRGLSTYFGARRGLLNRLLGRPATPVRAVEQVDLDIDRGEVLGLVGESGSGKSTLGMTILRLIRPTAGTVVFGGTDISSHGRRGLRALRRQMQMIFQDPMASLSPRMRIDRLVTEPYRINGVDPGERYSVADLMKLVQLSQEQATKYPHQLSSGQARRVGIARALAMRPDLIVADEPTAGLDVSAAANVLMLLERLRRELGLTYMIISHDLNIVAQVADRIAVMYLGRIVEIGPVDSILQSPLHPYTQGLLAAVPRPDPRAKRPDFVPPGEVPSPRHPPTGCHFHPRCRLAQPVCSVESPELGEAFPSHRVACFFWDSQEAGPHRTPVSIKR